LIASGGVVDKQPLILLVYHPVCATEEVDHFLYGAATPPVQEGNFAGRYIFLGLPTRIESRQLLFQKTYTAEEGSAGRVCEAKESRRIRIRIDVPWIESVEEIRDTEPDGGAFVEEKRHFLFEAEVGRNEGRISKDIVRTGDAA